MTTLTIDCQTCPVRGRHCTDCFVPVLGRVWLDSKGLDQEARLPGEDRLRPEEESAIATFAEAGLLGADPAARVSLEVRPGPGQECAVS